MDRIVNYTCAKQELDFWYKLIERAIYLMVDHLLFDLMTRLIEGRDDSFP